MTQPIEVSVQINRKLLLEGLVKAIEINFGDEHSQPSTIDKALITASHIFKCLEKTIREWSEDKRICAVLGSELGFGKYMELEDLFRDLQKETRTDEKFREALKDLFAALTKNMGRKHES